MKHHDLFYSPPGSCRRTSQNPLLPTLRWVGRLVLLLLLSIIANPAAHAQAVNLATVITTDCVEITCPTNLTLYTCSDSASVRSYPFDVNYTCPNVPPTSLVVDFECTPPPGTFPIGVHTINCAVLVNKKPVGRCTFTLTVVRDTQPPKIECPKDLLILACPTVTGACGEVVNYPSPVATDNSGSVAVVCDPPSGTFFPCGVHTIVCTAFDRCQNATRCEFKIVVRQAPQVAILCPTNTISVSLPCDKECVRVDYPAPTVLNGTLVECRPPPGTCLGAGAHVVTCVAKDDCGRIATCEFVVRVLPVRPEPPIIVCPNDLVITTCDPCEKINYPLPAVTNGRLASCEPAPGTCLKPGTYTVNCIATNECARSTCSFTIKVVERPRPIIRCPLDLVVETCDDCQIVNYPDPLVANGRLLSCDPPSGSCFKPGVNIVTCLASNECGTTECKFTVTVRQKPKPSIRCPEDIIVETCDDCAVVQYPAPLVANGTLAFCQPPSGTCFRVGTNIVSCVATNECGKDGCRFQVIVRQKPKPAIRCPQDIVVETCDPCEIVRYPKPEVLNGALAFCEPPPGTCFKPGETIVTCVATNECGRTECKFTVTVKPKPQPIIRCPQDIVVTSCNDCEKVEYPAPTVVNGTLISCTPPSGSCFKPGVNIVTCLASNECGRTECKFTITVRPGGAPPQITCPSNIVVSTCRECAIVDYPAPHVNNGTLVACRPASGTCLPPGVHVVTCLATNNCGRAECTFTVTVKQSTEPLRLRCPEDIIVETCKDGEIVSYPPPTVFGATDPSDYILKCDPPPGSFFPIGTNKVVCCVLDRCERRVCCEFNIVVRPGLPCMTPPGNMVLWTPFDEPFGPVAHNAVNGAPNGLHINNPAPFLGQKVFNSLIFDGVDDYVAVPNYNAILLDQTDLSIDAWIFRRDTGGRRVIVSKMGPLPGAVDPRGYEFYLEQGIMRLKLSGTATLDVNSGVLVPADNKWHHVVTTVRRSGGGLVRFFLDGVQVNVQAAAIPAPLGNSSRLHIGASTYPLPQNHFWGAIDEVEIFDRPLTLTEVTGLYAADRAGKCKVRCIVPWDVSFPTNGGYVTVMATICNYSVLPQTVAWMATGPMPILPPFSGVVVLPPTTCTNFPIQLCRPTNNVPVGEVVEWTMTVFPQHGCPSTCKGSVINPGPITTTTPEEIVTVPGTSGTVNVPVTVDGLPEGGQVRVRVVNPNMEPDTQSVSLNGLPPGTPMIVGGNEPAPADFSITFNVPIRFVKGDAIGLYTILVEADVDGDKDFETLKSFDIQNAVVPPPTLTVTPTDKGIALSWNDEGDGILESSSEPEGPWTVIPGARPGYLLQPSEKRLFFRVSVPFSSGPITPAGR